MNPETQWSLPFRYVVGIFCVLALVAFVFYAHDAVRNLVIAAFVAYLLNPAVDYLVRRARFSRTGSVNIVFFTSLILLVGLPATLTPLFYDEVQTVIQDVLDLSTQVSTLLSQPVQVGSLVFHLEAWGQNLLQLQNTVLTPLPSETLKFLESTSVGTLWFFVIVVSVYLLLSEWHTIREHLFTYVLPPYRPEMEELYQRIRRIWLAYLRGQIVLMLIVGVVFTIAWSIMGIPGALVLGMVAGLFTLVPDVGPFIAVALAAGVALLEGSTWIPLSNFWVAAIVVAVYLVLINLKNFFLRPIIMGRSVHMHEGLVFISIIVATILEGILGALLVVPVIASFVVIGGYIQRKVLGLPAFAANTSEPFVAPLETLEAPRRGIRGRKVKPADQESASALPETASASSAASPSKTNPARKKNNSK